MSISANVLIAAGASPLMSAALEEGGELVEAMVSGRLRGAGAPKTASRRLAWVVSEARRTRP